MTVASGAMAGAVALVLAVQNFAQYSSLVQIVQSNLPAQSHSAYVPQTRLYGITIDSSRGEAVMAFTPFTSPNVAAAFGAQYGMKMLNALPAFGQFIFALPQIQIGPGPQPHTVTVYFPPYATQSDINAYLASNGLTVQTWLSTDDASGRSVVVGLPQIRPVLINARLGIWRAMVVPNFDQARINAWATANGLKVISYNPPTGEVLIQGPKPKPVCVRTIHKVQPVVKATTITSPTTTKVYIAFKAGTSFNDAQSAIQAAGGQITSYDSGTELAVANVPASNVAQATTSLSGSSLVSCVSESSTACPGITPSSTGGTTNPTPTTGPTTPSTTTATGTGWTTTDVTPAPATGSVPAQLMTNAVDGHVLLRWTAIRDAQSYQVYRSSAMDSPALVATTTTTSLTDVGGSPGTSYSYSVVPVLSTGPDQAHAQTATATWVAATSNPVLVSVTPRSGRLSGSVALEA